MVVHPSDPQILVQRQKLHEPLTIGGAVQIRTLVTLSLPRVTVMFAASHHS